MPHVEPRQELVGHHGAGVAPASPPVPVGVATVDRDHPERRDACGHRVRQELGARRPKLILSFVRHLNRMKMKGTG